MNRTQNSILTLPASSKDKAKDWQLEILMEKLRSKASQYKTLPEISKNVRMTLLEKRYALDSVEKSQHQKCLDTLQHSIKVTSFQSMVERLESLTRQLGLKFVVEPSGVFISSDMFYLEIVLEPSGAVKDVKIHHEVKKEQQSCAELVNCLSRGDFSDFTAHLEGFTSIYQLNAEKKIKCKAFTALESLETDLSTLAQLQSIMKDPFSLIHKSPVGILEKRKGGHPMKLTYFVSPYDLLNVEKNDLEPINIDNIISKSLGYSVTVCMEGSAAHKLQTTTLITINRNMNGKSTPSYSSVTPQNSAVIPACFVLKLNRPMPMCMSLVRQIQQIHPWTEIDSVPTQPLLNLIVSHASDDKMKSSNNKGLFVTLPDQNHCYFMTENKNMEGVLVTSIPFTQPGHVTSILMVLREQALFNTIISSCVRPNSRQDFENMTMFEISALSPTHISVSLEHPIEESMATAEINLSDISNLECRIHNPGTPPPANTPDTISELASKILNKCLSLPVTLRTIIKLWENQAMRRTHYGGGHENFSLPLGPGDPGGHKGGPGPGLGDFGGLSDKIIKQEPMGGSTGHGMMMQGGASGGQGIFLNESMMASNFPNFPPSDGVLTSMELTNILSDTAEKCSKRQKRRSDEIWRSGKRKVGTEDSELMESSSCDSTSRSTPLSQEIEVTTPNSLLGFQPDLDLDPAEILGVAKSNTEFDTLDEIGDVEDMPKEPKRKREKSPDLIEKNIVTPNVSITPISSSPTSGYSTSMNQDKRPGIEIIPVPQSASTLIPSSITITPISSGQSKSSDERSKEKRSSKSSREDKGRSEKRKKRKRDESPMGPPGKVPMKQDPLNKPVTVSIKPTESPPVTPGMPTSPSMIRKLSASPTPNRTMSLSGKLSPNLMKTNLKSSSSSHQSPKHSPAHVPSSPKHSVSGISSPKHHGTSPKHPSASGSGKPSMSTLKSAASSPSSKSSSDSKKSSSKDGSREKDKKISNMSGVVNSKSKSSTKVKPLDLNMGEVPQDSLPSPSGLLDPSKSNSNQARNRKGSLSAIVDKLKVNAQHCDSVADFVSKSNNSSRDRTSISMSKSSDKNNAKIGETKNSEYMVKPSSDGMKITINKTRSKDSSSTKSSSASSVGKTGSSKIHTGLKPGVNSGPASKKPQQLQKSSSSTFSNSTSANYSGSLKTSSSSNKVPSSGVSKLSSSSSGLSKSASKPSSSPKTSSSVADFSRTKDRQKLSKSSSEKSLVSRKSSPTPSRDETDIFKIAQSKSDSFGPNLLMDGMMKQFDRNFQIPKLSARVSEDKKKNDSVNNTVDRKTFELMAKNEMTYPIAVPASKIFENSMDQKVRNNINNVNAMGMGAGKLKSEEEDKRKDTMQNLYSSQGKEDAYKLDMASDQMTESLNVSSKFLAPAPRDDRKDNRRGDGDALDFSSKSGPQAFPQSPSVSVHIVKSPAPSPMVNPSPHSASPRITDEELKDEALVGLRK